MKYEKLGKYLRLCVCGYTYHWSLSESALCAVQCAQMWGSSAEAQAHWLYFYRSAAWRSCSAKFQLSINHVFLLFPSESSSKPAMLMVHLEPRWTGEYGPSHFDYSVFHCGHNHPDFYRFYKIEARQIHLMKTISDHCLLWHGVVSRCLRELPCLLWDVLSVLWGLCWRKFKCTQCFGHVRARSQ